MNQSIEGKKTIRLVSSIALLKERELWQYRKKVLKLEQQIEDNSNNTLNKHKYNLAQARFTQLKTTIENLKQLELQLYK